MLNNLQHLVYKTQYLKKQKKTVLLVIVLSPFSEALFKKKKAYFIILGHSILVF